MKSEDKRKGRSVKNERTTTRRKYELDYLYDYYYNARRAEGRAPATLETYRLNYAGFCEYLDAMEIPRDIRNIDAELGRDYVIWLRYEKRRFSDKCSVPDDAKTIGLLPKSVNTRIKSMKTMFKYLAEIDVIDADPFANVKPLPDVGRDIEILTVDELKKLLNVPDQRQYVQFRDYVILNTLTDGMFRINEVLTLRVQDVDKAAGVVTIRKEIAKTRKARIVPLTARTLKLIAELIKENEEFNSDYVFLANYGEPLTPNHFRHRLKLYTKRAGITKRVHPHLLRHTGATLFLEEGGNASYLQKILGHSDGRMTAHYTHLSDRSVKDNHDKNSPMNAIISKHEKARKTKR